MSAVKTVTGSSRTATQLEKRRPRVVKTYVERLKDMKRQAPGAGRTRRTVTIQRESVGTDTIFLPSVPASVSA